MCFSVHLPCSTFCSEIHFCDYSLTSCPPAAQRALLAALVVGWQHTQPPCPAHGSVTTLHPLDYPAWAAFCPSAAPKDGLELMRDKAWGGLLCPKLPQRAPGKRHQPHQSTHRDTKKHQGQTGSGFAMCTPVGGKLCCRCSLTS